MKKPRIYPLLAVAALGALVFGPFAYGQDATSATTPSVSSTPPPGGPGPGGPGGHHPGERLEKLAEALGLTDTQKEQLKPVFQSSMEQMKALKDDTTLTPEAKHEKVKSIREDMDQQFKSILTPEQLEKWKEMKEARHEKHGGLNGGAGTPSGPPPITTGTTQ